METKEYMENKKISHDSSILGDSTVQWHQEAVLGSGERRPRDSPYVQNVIFNALQWEKVTAHTKACP